MQRSRLLTSFVALACVVGVAGCASSAPRGGPASGTPSASASAAEPAYSPTAARLQALIDGVPADVGVDTASGLIVSNVGDLDSLTLYLAKDGEVHEFFLMGAEDEPWSLGVNEYIAETPASGTFDAAALDLSQLGSAYDAIAADCLIQRKVPWLEVQGVVGHHSLARVYCSDNLDVPTDEYSHLALDGEQWEPVDAASAASVAVFGEVVSGALGLTEVAEVTIGGDDANRVELTVVMPEAERTISGEPCFTVVMSNTSMSDACQAFELGQKPTPIAEVLDATALAKVYEASGFDPAAGSLVGTSGDGGWTWTDSKGRTFDVTGSPRR